MPISTDVKVRLRDEEGFGLVELLIAMLMLNIGILAIVASFNSGAVALRRASHVSTASALADQQMEAYRALLYSQIGLDTGQIAGLDNTYKCDSVLGALVSEHGHELLDRHLRRQHGSDAGMRHGEHVPGDAGRCRARPPRTPTRTASTPTSSTRPRRADGS